MQRDTIVKTSSNLQSWKIPEGTPIRLKNRFFHNWKHQKLNFSTANLYTKENFLEKFQCRKRSFEAHQTLFLAENIYESK